MMRRPTPPETAYAWHRDTLAGKKPPITMNDPQCGWYLRRYKGAKGEITVIPATIYLHQATDDEGYLSEPEKLVCEIGGEVKDVHAEWTWLAGRPITRAEYMKLIAAAAFGDEPATASPAPSQEEIRLASKFVHAQTTGPLFDPNKPPY